MRILIRKVKNLQNLEKLSISTKDFSNQGILIDMLNECTNLKDLTISQNEDDEKIFSESEVSSILGIPMDDEKLMIKLKRFSSNFSKSDFEMAKFISNHVDSLEELELTYEPEEYFEEIWPKFKNLRNLTLMESNSRTNHIKVESVKCFKSNVYQDLTKNFESFPNLEIFINLNVNVTAGEIYEKLHTLEVQYLDLNYNKNGKFPILKNLIVSHCIARNSFSSSLWINFCKNTPNVENVTISLLGKAICCNCILDCFPYWKKLKKFQYRHEIFGRRVESFEINEIVPKNLEFYKISVDMTQKIIKICNFIVEKDYKIMSKLYDHFDGFEFIEFCFQNPQCIKYRYTFDPYYVMQTRTKARRLPINPSYRENTVTCGKCYVDNYYDSNFNDEFVNNEVACRVQ